MANTPFIFAGIAICTDSSVIASSATPAVLPPFALALATDCAAPSDIRANILQRDVGFDEL